jgi:hypothetical protein
VARRALVGLALVVAACSGGGSHPAVVDRVGGPAVLATTAPTTTTTVDPGVLPQTRARPSGTDPAFQARMALLWQAVVTGHVAVALPAFFPLSAYKQVKALANPASDWQHRLLAQFDADIERVHASVGSAATLVSVNVPDGRATWVNPGVEVNKIGYWRVYNSAMTYRSGGRLQSFTIMSLISWRGEWYVVHFRTPPS